jgi:hypothetical protein
MGIRVLKEFTGKSVFVITFVMVYKFQPNLQGFEAFHPNIKGDPVKLTSLLYLDSSFKFTM